MSGAGERDQTADQPACMALKIHPEIDRAHMQHALIRPIDVAGDCDWIEITADRSVFVEDRLIREIETPRFRPQPCSVGLSAFEQS